MAGPRGAETATAIRPALGQGDRPQRFPPRAFRSDRDAHQRIPELIPSCQYNCFSSRQTNPRHLHLALTISLETVRICSTGRLPDSPCLRGEPSPDLLTLLTKSIRLRSKFDNGTVVNPPPTPNGTVVKPANPPTVPISTPRKPPTVPIRQPPPAPPIPSVLFRNEPRQPLVITPGIP
jgi:hypothetical protein